MERLDSVRKNIYRSYDEEYLKRILVDFSVQVFDYSNLKVENRNITKVLNHFFDDLIYQSKSKSGRYSPQEIIDSDILLATALNYIDNHPKFYYKKSDEANLRDFFYSSSLVGKVTNFNCVIARKIFECYVPFKGATIFDFSCGFGSRMLAALSSRYEYNYIGVDPYRELYLRLLNFSDWILQTLQNRATSQIFNLGSEIFIPSLVDQIDLSFSSPPYFNYEKYTESNTQSYIMFPTYEEWLEKFVLETLKNIYQYTKRGGLHLVNLEDTKRITIVDNWIEMASSVGFRLENTESIPTLKRKCSKNENKLLIMKKL